MLGVDKYEEKKYYYNINNYIDTSSYRLFRAKSFFIKLYV